MPIILKERDHEAWLDPKNENTEALLTPCPPDKLRAYPVSTRVNNSRNEGAELFEPA